MPADPSIAEAKRRLRDALKRRRDAMSPQERATSSAAITDRLCALVAPKAQARLLSYSSFGSEFDTSAFHARMRERGVRLLLPRIDPATRRLDVFEVPDAPECLLPGPWGILEPDPGRCSAANGVVPDWVLVPGLAFDRKGNRLGYGAGFYDRLLPEIAGAPRFAAAFDLQIVDEIPVDRHDQRVGMLVTESGVIHTGQIAH